MKGYFFGAEYSPLQFSSSVAELLKAATMQAHGRAKVFRDCTRFGFLNAKMHNLPLFHLFWVSFKFLCWLFWPFSLRKTFERKYWSRKKVRF